MTTLVTGDTYHIAEWKKSGGDAYLSTLLAPLNITSNAVALDVGCGSGYVSTYLSRDGRVRSNFGLELALETLQLARNLANGRAQVSVNWISGRAEELPLRTASVDHLICRAVLPYTRIQSAVSEMSRVVADGGTVLLLLHSWRMYASKISLNPRKWKNSAVLVLILLLGFVFHVSGWLLRPHFGRLRIGETFQTLSRMRRLLRQYGLVIYKVQLQPEFLVYAIKLPASGELPPAYQSFIR